MAQLSPMMVQYMEIKERTPNALLFFRLGDFYELFFEDAKVASKELELVLTGRDCGLEERAPMCGVPYHSYENYVSRLVAKGYKVAICEQIEDPAVAKGIVRRDVIRVITPGTVIESSMLDEGKNNYICSVNLRAEGCGLCFSDISTGEVRATEITGDSPEIRIIAELSRFSPKEVLLNPLAVINTALIEYIKKGLQVQSLDPLEEEQFDTVNAQALISKQMGEQSSSASGFVGRDMALGAVGALFSYLLKTQMTAIERLSDIKYYIGEEYMKLDSSTRRNLELTETMRTREKKGSLLGVIDRTETSMGKRLLRSWMDSPLIEVSQIQARLNAVDELVCSTILRQDISEALGKICDIERLMTRIVCASANARELRAFAAALTKLPEVKQLVSQCGSRELSLVHGNINLMEDIEQLIDCSITDEPPVTLREGNLIKSGYNDEVDSLRHDMTGGKDILASVELSEREKTGIPKLKIGYNRVFGYYIEVSNSYKNLVPETYIRKQTLSNCERYITEELKGVEGRVLGAQDRLIKLEYKIFDQIRAEVATALPRLRQTAQAVAKLDVYTSFAEVSVRNNYYRPIVNKSGKILLKNSRHPVVESLINSSFVPNDVLLDQKDNRVNIITGPNMAGKSTYMRQVALIVYMAQLGCFVPSESAEIGIVDSIFTRVGASDDLASGQSTFMVEMNEVAYILKNATKESLLLLDEIGRGTSTFDGMSIARAVLEYAADKKKLGAKTLFATHYHELTVLEQSLEGVRNYNIAVKRHGEEITFLRRIIPGGADDSYGIDVAKLAGVPAAVISKARQFLTQLESGQFVTPVRSLKKVESSQIEMPLTPPGELEAVRRLKDVDINSMTPIDAFKMIDELSKLVK
ncbi:MAG: DNA mismatch repair protein MutS [Oscillospiraceae bacterium]|jgi:DNA mismatch repair protein MutS|nr:DNA mismatch repair protein MutS [Oscillospiraceae bacterium]